MRLCGITVAVFPELSKYTPSIFSQIVTSKCSRVYLYNSSTESNNQCDLIQCWQLLKFPFQKSTSFTPVSIYTYLQILWCQVPSQKLQPKLKTSDCHLKRWVGKNGGYDQKVKTVEMSQRIYSNVTSVVWRRYLPASAMVRPSIIIKFIHTLLYLCSTTHSSQQWQT
jgi:hypothetical protein